jgi:hypothetical protein
MNKLITMMLLLLCFFIAPAPAQTTFEYGTPAELRGIGRIFIDTGADAAMRTNIVKNIEKRLPELVIVTCPEEADIRLVFVTDNRYFVSHNYQSAIRYDYGGCTGHTVIESYEKPSYWHVVRGMGMVVMCAGEQRLRVLMSFQDERGSWPERHPSTNFARAFVKEYRKANASKTTPELKRH